MFFFSGVENLEKSRSGKSFEENGYWADGSPFHLSPAIFPSLSLPSLPFLFNLYIYRKPNHGMNDKLVKLTKKNDVNVIWLLCSALLL